MTNYCNLYRILHGKTFSRYCTTQLSYSSKTHYEVLGVSSDCTTKEIKSAYVKLCKEFHPDKSPADTSQHKKFVQLNEAYTILVRPQSRKEYDLTLSSENKFEFNASTNHYRNAEYYRDYSYYRDYQNQFDERKHGPYDNARWSNPGNNYHYYRSSAAETEERQSKVIIVAGCLVLMIVGAFVHYATFSVGTTFSERKLDEKDRIISHTYMKVRQKAIHSKDKEQVNELKDRLSVISLEPEKAHNDQK